MMNEYTKIRELKKTLRSSGQQYLNGKPVSLLLSRWRETYEYTEGSNIVFDTDFFGKKRLAGNVTPGPFELMGDEKPEAEFEL